MAASIEDVAKLSNVSISTVSRVLNRRNIVNSDTRERVEQAIRDLNYRPNVFARGLMLRRSNILGLLLPDLHGEYYSEILRGANQKARELGYHLLISAVSAEDDGQDVLAAVGAQGLVDGLAVMVTEMSSKIGSSLKASGMPLVVLDGDVPGVQHDTVAIDQRGGAEAAASFLVSSHPRDRIVFLGGHPTNLDTIDRLAALRSVLSGAGRELTDADVVHLDYEYNTAFDFASDHVINWASEPTTIFAANDEMAAGVIDAANSAEFRVPENMRVIGFDDTRIALLTRPRLTTVRVPKAEIGAMAVELLCKRLADPDRPLEHVTLPTRLIVRESCGRS